MIDQNREQLLDLEEQLRQLVTHKQAHKLMDYRPYLKQIEFHASGQFAAERLLMAGNQQGKTYCGAAEMAMHLTGEYPDWWPGRRWDRPVHAWAGGESSHSVSTIGQVHLLGDMWPEGMGTGMIPKECIVKYTMQRGVPDAVDTVWIKHKSGGISSLQFKSYEQGRAKWQGTSKDIVWFDEEPPEDVYAEGLARITATGGMVYVTFTPLKGMSNVVKKYLRDPTPQRLTTKMSLDDAEHLTPEEKEKLLSRYDEWERETRLYGVPAHGSGRIFPFADSTILCDPFELPPYFAVIAGLDIGRGNHPTAVAWLAWDRDTDIYYVFDEYRMKGGNIPTHASAIKTRMPMIPVSWPHDGLQKDTGSGEVISHQYRAEGVNTLGAHAHWIEGNYSVEAGISEMYSRMSTGKFKVFKTCQLWMEEYRHYHREDGKIVKIDDDLLSATRYAIMMRRFAKPAVECWRPRKTRKGPIIAKGLDYNILG